LKAWRASPGIASSHVWPIPLSICNLPHGI
jgi:hypothetical protein